MKALLIAATILLTGSTASEPDRMEEKAARECKAGGGCYLVPKAALEKMRGLILEQREQIDVRDKAIEDLHGKLDRSCA